jgi:CBS domain-containing protein
MTAPANTLSEMALVEIRNLHVIAGDGQATNHRTVRCPVHGRTVTLETCLACAESGGVAKPSGTRNAYASCRRAGGVAGAPRDDAGALLETTPTWSVMSTQVVAVRPDVSLEALADLLLDRVIGGAPVVDSGGRPLGMVSRTDLLDERFIASGTREALSTGERRPSADPTESDPSVHVQAVPCDTVADAMTRGTLTVPEEAPVAKAAALMAVRGIHRVLAVSDDGKVVGILTAGDVARWVAQLAGHLPPSA